MRVCTYVDSEGRPCPNKHEGLGYCSKHYQRLKRHGDVDGGHFHWGEVPGVARAHQRVWKARGKASDHVCQYCREPAHEWAYDHSDPDALIGDDHGKRVPYSLDPSHYLPLCRPCHKRLDHNRLELVSA